VRTRQEGGVSRYLPETKAIRGEEKRVNVNPYLLPSLEFGPVVFRRLLAQLAPSQLDEALVAGRFTPREVMAHLADWEPIMRGRIATACASPGATLVVYDEEEMALQNGYATSDPEEQCAIFARERAITAQFAREIAAEDWQKEVLHPERGTLSVADLANLLLGHDLYHIEQLSAYLE